VFSIGVNGSGRPTHCSWVNNGMYYNNVLLIQKLLPVRREISGEFVIFQQDKAPTHGACEAISLLEEMNDIDEWKQHLFDVWDGCDRVLSIAQLMLCKRHRKYICAKGRYFQHLVKFQNAVALTFFC